MDSTIIRPGAVFDTKFERLCVALAAPDDLGEFEGLDSDSVRCQFLLRMVTVVHRVGER